MATKLVDSEFLDGGLTQIADSIRAKTGTSEEMEFPQGFVAGISDISGGTKQFHTFLFKDVAKYYNKSLYWIVNYDGTTKLATITLYDPNNYNLLPVFNTLEYAFMWRGSGSSGGPWLSYSITDTNKMTVTLSSSTSQILTATNASKYPPITIVESTPNQLIFTLDGNDPEWSTKSSASISGQNSSCYFQTINGVMLIGT